MNTSLPETWPLVRIGALVERVESQNPADSSSDDFHYIDISSVDNITKRVHLPSLVPVNEAPSRARQIVRPNDVLVSTVRPSLNAVAKVPDNLTRPFASTGFCVLRAKEPLLDPNFLFHFTISDFFVSRLVNCQKGGSYPAVTDGDILAQTIPLPPLSEQQRIVDILQEAEEIRRLRAQAEAKTAELIPAIFHDRFVRDQAHEYQPLHKLAEVVSGVAIGRKSRGMAIEVPYIRVANVQAGYIDLTEIKTTPTTENEIEQYALQNGDVLLTEGGDFDKLGRGALWEGQVSPCIHQNHVFRVRPNREKLLPRFFAHYLQSAKAKGYFLRCAKKTTNLASINLTQLMALPVPVVSIEEQEAFEVEIESASKAVTKEGERLFAALSRSLSAHAFTGKLTEDWRKNRPVLGRPITVPEPAIQYWYHGENPDPDIGLGKSVLPDLWAVYFGTESDLKSGLVGLCKEQKGLLYLIRRLSAHKELPLYFTAEWLADRGDGATKRNPQLIESHLSVFAAQGIVIPVSRVRDAVPGKPFAASYRLPMNEEGAAPEQQDDVKAERMKHQRTRAAGKRP